MKILVTGANGFIGKNLIAQLKNEGYNEIFEYDRETDIEKLEFFCKEADFVFHLAGVNRPDDNSEFMKGNFGFTSILLNLLKKYNNTCPVMISSSIQAELDNPYGISKKAGEDLIKEYSKDTGTKTLIYRFPNVFGKWSRPNYNSAVATFCHNIARDIPIKVNDPDVIMNLVHIDDVVRDLISVISDKSDIKNENQKNFYEIKTVYTERLGDIANLIYSFRDSRNDKRIPDMSDEFTKKLYSTYLSFLPEDSFSYDLKMNKDDRGSFTEFIKTPGRGQVSVNISKPGITKGNHWHHTKNEKFLVVSGNGVIRFRKIDSDKIIEYFVNDKQMQVVDIPTGYTHNIENLGKKDMVTIMWANEEYDPDSPDTYFLEV